MDKPHKMLALEYFVGGLPAGIMFKMSIDDLNDIINESEEDKGYNLNTTAEVCLIGLVSYFEAFCKNKFASLINICPDILNNLLLKRPDLSINVKDLIDSCICSNNMLGFLLSERFDFGSAKNINNIFYDLLGITIFSTDEIKRYNNLINDRNLLVHHGGIYTIKYHRNRFIKKSMKGRIFWDSLIIRKKEFKVWATFLDKIALKIVNITHKSLCDFINKEKIELVKENKEALDYLLWYLE